MLEDSRWMHDACFPVTLFSFAFYRIWVKILFMEYRTANIIFVWGGIIQILLWGILIPMTLCCQLECPTHWRVACSWCIISLHVGGYILPCGLLYLLVTNERHVYQLHTSYTLFLHLTCSVLCSRYVMCWYLWVLWVGWLTNLECSVWLWWKHRDDLVMLLFASTCSLSLNFY